MKDSESVFIANGGNILKYDLIKGGEPKVIYKFESLQDVIDDAFIEEKVEEK